MRAFFSAAASLILAATATAQETILREVVDPATDTHIEVTALFTSPPPTGYLPVRVKLVNNLKSPRSARLEFGSTSDYRQTFHAKSDFSIEAAPGKAVTRDILVPVGPPQKWAYSGTRIELDLSGSMGKASGFITTVGSSSMPAVLMSNTLHTHNGSQLDAEVQKGSTSYRSGSQEFAGRFDPKQLPDDWLAYSGFDTILMLASDWTSVPPGARHGILSWVRMGGHLVIYDDTGSTASALGLPAGTSLGTIDLVPIGGDFRLDPLETLALVTNTAVLGDPLQYSLREHYTGHWPLKDSLGNRDFRYGMFMVVLVLFGIIVGPVNLFVFAKSGRRHRLFITTPIISLGASVLMVALIIFQDGFGGTGVRLAHMEVRPDEANNAAYIHQEQFSRTGVLTSKSFELNVPALFAPVPIPESRWARYTDSNSKGDFSLQPGSGRMSATGDWFQSRSEHGHVLQAVVPTRGRIELTPEANTLLSTFDFHIESLFFLDGSGNWHKAGNIAPGKAFHLTEIAASDAEAEMGTLQALFSSRHRMQFHRARHRPSHFVAVTTAAPGIDTHPGIRWSETRTVITGPVVAP